VTRTGQWVGTLDYVAPEQIRAGRVDARADVYALGGVLCFMLTGRVPFERESDEAKLWAQLSDPPPVPSRLRDSLPQELDAVVARALAKAPDARYPSAGDLGRAARAAAVGGAPSQPERMVARGAAAPAGARTELGLAAEVSTVTAARPDAASGPTVRQPRRRRLVALAALAALTALGGTVAALALPSGDPPGRAARKGRPPAAAAAAPLRVAQTIRHVGHRPNGIAIANGDLWVTSFDQPWVTRIDAATGRERRQHPRVGLGASSIARAGMSVWVATRLEREVVRIDARSGRVTARLHPGEPPWRLAAGLGSLWVATSSTVPAVDQLVRYDAAGLELGRTPMPRGAGAVTTGSGAVWVAERDVPDVLRLDPHTGRTVVWAKLLAPASALYYGGGYVWATLGSADSIARIDPRRRDGVVTTAAGHRPSQAVLAGERLFVASTTDHTVLVIDPRTALVVGAPLHVALNPSAITADRRAVWVTGAGENTITRIAYD
jgi:DNA-binding beta-propeller fold protein YncE